MKRPAPRRAAAVAQSAPKPKTSPTSVPETAHAEELGLERMLFFSDAVFAIAITLLALDIRLPTEGATLTNAELLDALLGIWPKYLSYIISFLVIGGFWIAHHNRFRVISRYDGRLMQLNLLLLMVIAFVPFPTAVLSESGNRTSTLFYALTMIVAGILSTLMWWYALRGNRLVPADLSRAQRRNILLKSLSVPAIFLLSIGIAFIDEDSAKYSWLLIALIGLPMR
jgi:uncharacterized membrane protein